MSDKKPLTEGYQPLTKGYQPTSQQPLSSPIGIGNVQGGYQPPMSEAKPTPAPPPKKP